jgi:hypothetical protein
MVRYEVVARALQALRQFYSGYARIHERQSLLNRPWEEEFLHFARDGSLHGHLSPPADGRPRSVTSDGWCPGWARQARQSRAA